MPYLLVVAVAVVCFVIGFCCGWWCLRSIRRAAVYREFKKIRGGSNFVFRRYPRIKQLRMRHKVRQKRSLAKLSACSPDVDEFFDTIRRHF